MPVTEHQHDPLRSWDWRAELARQERSVLWLSRKVGMGYRAAYRRANGEVQPSIDELRAFARALGIDPAGSLS